MLSALAVLLGAIVGSFLNVCIWRLPREESVVWPSSACPRCKHPIRWYDNIPVLSFVFLRAKCRDCSAVIPLRYPLVEILGALCALAAFHYWGWSPYGAAAFVILAGSIAVFFIDLEHQIIPDEITLPGIVAGVVFSAFFPLWHGTSSHLWGFILALAGILCGGGFLYLAGVLGELIFKKEAMGGGDVKLLAALGAFLGWKGVAITVFFASLTGASVGIFLKMLRGQDRIPFGPYLVVGAIFHMLVGEQLFLWYLNTVLR